VLGDAGIRSFYRPLLKLLRDETLQVQRAALVAARKLQHPKMWPAMIECLTLPNVRPTTIKALVAGGKEVLTVLQSAFTKEEQTREVLICIARICGRIRGDSAIALLRKKCDCPDSLVRSHVLAALNQCGYQAEGEQQTSIQQQIKAEIGHAVQMLAILVDIVNGEAVSLLTSALEANLAQSRERIFFLLAFIYDSQAILKARDHFIRSAADDGSGEKRAYALEMLDILLSSELKTMVIPVLDDQDPATCLKRLRSIFPQQTLNRTQRLQALIAGESAWIHPWIRVCAVYTVVQLAAAEFAETVISALSDPDQLVRETAIWALWKLDPAVFSPYAEQVAQDPSLQVIRSVEQLKREQEGGTTMISTVEKVMRLKAVGFFSETPEEVLAEVASILEELEISSGEMILEKGETGNAMYIIVDGQVRIHDGERNVTDLGENEIFGELSLLDPGPHPASVTALTDTRLLRLDQEPFWEVIEDHSPVARRIMQVLARQLRRAQAQIRPGRPTGDVLSEIHEKLTKKT
jgi:CRP-like cAMP-binding protein/HEAT repeat protein